MLVFSLVFKDSFGAGLSILLAVLGLNDKSVFLKGVLFSANNPAPKRPPKVGLGYLRVKSSSSSTIKGR